MDPLYVQNSSGYDHYVIRNIHAGLSYAKSK